MTFTFWLSYLITLFQLQKSCNVKWDEKKMDVPGKDQEAGMAGLKAFYGTYLESLRKTLKTLRSDSWQAGQSSNNLVFPK